MKWILPRSGWNITKVKMKGQEENRQSASWRPDSILCLDLNSGYSGVYFLIILLTEYIYWMGFSISMWPFKILRIFFNWRNERATNSVLKVLSFLHLSSYMDWSPSKGALIHSENTQHGRTSQFAIQNGNKHFSEPYTSSLQDSVPRFAHIHQGASRAWFAMFANFCGVNFSTEADFKLLMWCHLWPGRTWLQHITATVLIKSLWPGWCEAYSAHLRAGDKQVWTGHPKLTSPVLHSVGEGGWLKNQWGRGTRKLEWTLTLENSTCLLDCVFSSLLSFSVCFLCDLTHPQGINADEIMISKIHIFNPDLTSELQSRLSSVSGLSLSDWPSNHKLGTPIIKVILSLVH